MDSSADQPTHILVVEDDDSLGRWIVDYLSDNGMLASRATDGDVALDLLREDQPDLVLLDINLPGRDGFAVCRAAREFYQRPILMLTAREDEEDEIIGLEAGATDYLIKPVRPRALLTRIQLLLNDSQPAQQLEAITGTLVVNRSSRNCTLAGTPIKLSTTEFELLWLLVSRAGEICSREDMVNQMRGINYDGFDRSVDILVSRLRKKLGDQPGHPQRIKTVRGVGYMLVADAWDNDAGG